MIYVIQRIKDEKYFDKKLGFGPLHESMAFNSAEEAMKMVDNIGDGNYKIRPSFVIPSTDIMIIGNLVSRKVLLELQKFCDGQTRVIPD